MKAALLVGLGGFFGAIGRYKLGGYLLHHFSSTRLPLGTLFVNVAGCFAIGFLGGMIERLHLPHAQARLFLITGVLGGFTTFSSFGYETLFLLRRGQSLWAAAYAGGSLMLGLLAVWVGTKLAFGVWAR